jgi:peroxiredoxin Q/BCP
MTEQAQEFCLPNLAAGPNPFSLADLPANVSFAVVFFQRDHYCMNCRRQVQRLADRIDEFRERGAEVISIVPEPVDRVETWQGTYDLPYPLLADPNTKAGNAYDQPVRFGVLGRLSDFFGRMPEVVVVDRRGTEPTITYTHKGSSTFDRPEIDEILAALDELRVGA